MTLEEIRILKKCAVNAMSLNYELTFTSTGLVGTDEHISVPPAPACIAPDTGKHEPMTDAQMRCLANAIALEFEWRHRRAAGKESAKYKRRQHE